MAPVILLVTAFLLVAESAWLDRREPAGRGPAVLAVVLVAATLVWAGHVVASAVLGSPAGLAPTGRRRWPGREHHCERHPHEPAVLKISPVGWTVTLTCDDLR